MSKTVSRRDFLAGAAAGTMGVASLSGMVAANVAKADEAPVAAGTYDIMGQYSTYNHGENPDKVAAATPEEFIISKGDGVLAAGGMVDELGITPADFMLNVPAWLGTAPEITEIADTEECDVLVIGAGNAGTVAALRAQEMGANVILAETQTYDEYDEYACDMACYNSKLFLDKGTPEIDTMDIFNEYMRQYRGHAHQKLVRDYATRSGEMLDWMCTYIPQDLIDNYAKTSNYKGNANFNGEHCGQKSFIGMTQ